MKPFKPPTIVGRPPVNSQPPTYPAGPPLKRRKLSQEHDDNAEVIAAAANVLKKPPPPKKFQPPPPRKPLEPVQNPNSSLPSSSQTETGVEGYYTVLWWVALNLHVTSLLTLIKAQIHDQEEQDMGWRRRVICIQRLRTSTGCIWERSWQICVQRRLAGRLPALDLRQRC
jgi:hypothetical protein